MTEAERQDSIGNILKRFYSGVEDAVGENREDHRSALNRAYDQAPTDVSANRLNMMFGSNRTVTMANEMAGIADPLAVEARNKMNLGFSDDPVVRKGQRAGHLISDVIQDRGREFWWLINAAQAVGTVGQDAALKQFAPDLYAKDSLYMNKDTGQLTLDDGMDSVPIKGKRALMVKDEKGRNLAYKQGDQILPTKDISVSKGGQYARAKHRKGHIDMLNIPVGVAINSGIGLMNPFGGQEGYKAVFESEDDASKSSNPIMEVAAKYVLGKTGNLLPWDEFKQVRPDVSKDEYMRYKAFKFDNDGDINPFDDGQVALPTGVAKYTNEGIHGPEVQFLGRSLPLATAVMPAAGAIASTAYGARRGGVKGGLKYGAAGTAGSMVLGNIIESIRRNRNAEENKTDTIGM